MSLALMVAWALSATAPPAPVDHVPAWADSQIIVVEVPERSFPTPTPTASATSSPHPTQTPAVTPATPAAADPGARGDLPATGLDAAVLIASALGVAAVVGGAILRRRRRRPA